MARACDRFATNPVQNPQICSYLLQKRHEKLSLILSLPHLFGCSQMLLRFDLQRTDSYHVL
jgi:hypothetical protein